MVYYRKCTLEGIFGEVSQKIQPLILIKSVDDNLIEVKVLALFLWFGGEGQTLIFDINKGCGTSK